MKFRKLLCLGVAASAMVSSQAQAADIILIDQGFSGTPAQQAAFRAGFQIAAAYWGSVLTNNVTIRLGVGTAALDPGIIGSTGSSRMTYTVANWEAGVNATKSNSAVDTNIVLPTLTNGAAAFVTNGPNSGSNGVDTSTFRYDNETTGDDAINNKTLFLNTANVKAIGGTATYDNDPTSQGYNPQQLDGQVQFSSNFGFDFNPTDGVSANTFDFIAVAIHEIGHALGFVSGVDTLDLLGGPNSPLAELGDLYNFNQTTIFSALDMFRYNNDPHNLVAGNGPVLDLSVGTASYFSIDGGLTQWGGGSLFSTGAYNGDRQQASHWKDLGGCTPGEGIMDPNFCYEQVGQISALDLAAFDAIGWNIAANSRGSNYTITTPEIYRQFATSGVPEPTTWAMMLFGFGAMGFALRRNRKVTARVRFA